MEQGLLHCPASPLPHTFTRRSASVMKMKMKMKQKSVSINIQVQNEVGVGDCGVSCLSAKIYMLSAKPSKHCGKI